MNILIDKARMKILAKHRNQHVLANLAWIEMHDMHIAILPLDTARTFAQFTELELRMLYAHSTGEEFPGNQYPALLQVILDIVRRMPEGDMDFDEIEAQAKCIKQDTPYRYRFVAGSNRPAREADLFEPEAIMVARNKNGELMALQNDASDTEELFQSHIIETGEVETVNLDEQKQTKKTPKAKKEIPVKKGSKKQIIWDKANALWEAAGKPMEIKEIAPIRKQAMNELEAEHGISKTSASSSLGGWQKEILK